jgi:phosphatidylserine/phosphatidylglycerophosphate/cardiolipin synthase-like enzyme
MGVRAMSDWLLTADERGNPHTRLDRRHPDGAAYTGGNEVRALVHGTEYFRDLYERIANMVAGDVVFFTDWRGDPNQRMRGRGTEISKVLCEAASRGVIVKGLIWRSHWDRLAFSAAENEHLGEEIEAAGGECLRDMRVRVGGSHHQKMVVLRHPGRPEHDIAYVGGIDLCHSRRDDEQHHGDPQAVSMASEYGPTPPWHDVQLAVRGPAVGDIDAGFRERWDDPAPLTRNPFHRLHDLLRREDTRPDPLPAQLPDPPPSPDGQCVQVLRTYPYRRRGFPFAPNGERSIARAYRKALSLVRNLIYIEDQYLWSTEIAELFGEALAANPDLHLIGVVPMYPDASGLTGNAETLGRQQAIETLRRAGGDRVAVYGIENREGTPIYVHAKVCVMDDRWTCVGSDNINLRSWTHDSELSLAVVDDDPVTGFGRALRLRLHREHLERENDGTDAGDLWDAAGVFAAYAAAAQRLEQWHEGGRRGPRPPGRLRSYQRPALRGWSALLAREVYRLIADPDGRPPSLRRAHAF